MRKSVAKLPRRRTIFCSSAFLTAIMISVPTLISLLLWVGVTHFYNINKWLNTSEWHMFTGIAAMLFIAGISSPLSIKIFKLLLFGIGVADVTDEFILRCIKASTEMMTLIAGVGVITAFLQILSGPHDPMVTAIVSLFAMYGFVYAGVLKIYRTRIVKLSATVKTHPCELV